MNLDEIESVNDCVSFLRLLPDRMEGFGDDGALIVFRPRKMAEVLEASRLRDSDDDNETLVKSCNTCKNYTRKRKWCRVHDYSPSNPSPLPLIWPYGPCHQWECKYNSHGGVTK
jgi:hypothetical protein